MDRATRRLRAHAVIGALLGSAIMVWRHPASPLYPACPVYRLLHVRCPGCGATRALIALLHGHVLQALHWNALFVVALPVLMAYAAAAYRRVMSEAEFEWPLIQPAAIVGSLGVTVTFAVARDILNL